MKKIYNFSKGPSMLPEEVLVKARLELLDYNGTGCSVMELDCTCPEYMEIMDGCESALRELMNIPQNYRILFLHGGITTQFAAIPLNLLSDHRCADYVITGQHSKKAYLEAKKYGDIAIAASSAGASPTFSTVPELKSSDFRPDADYVHVCFNNTIYGTRFSSIPETGNIPLVAEMSSCILSEPIDVTKFALIYASAQQNMGIAGLTVVILRDDLIGGARPDTPASLDYKVLAENRSMLDTPPAFAIYMMKLMLEWMLENGGLVEMKRRNERKAGELYDYLDSQKYYTAPVDRNCRSMTNVRFVTGDAKLDEKFVKEAAKAGIVGISGHRSVGGMCASLYNAMPLHAVTQLIEFMTDFANDNTKLSGY